MQKNSSLSEVKSFLKVVKKICKLPVSNKYRKLVLDEYPFDSQLLNISPLYRSSRKFYFSLGGVFRRKICSTMRSLSAQDLFKDEIDFSPAFSELMWFKDHVDEVADPMAEIAALGRFSDISLFHEQNHRVVWRLLPPAPTEQRDFCRYLNFAESLVVTLDVALGDEVGKTLSPLFERMNLLYRPAGNDKWADSKKEIYRSYLLSVFCSTYYALELIHHDDILNAVDYVFPQQKALNRAAVKRGLELNEHFTRITNPQWQSLYWKSAQQKLKKIHHGSPEEKLYLPEDPLDLEADFFYVRRVLDFYGL
jgi:hypothetical protein